MNWAGHEFSVSCTEHAGDAHDASALLDRLLNWDTPWPSAVLTVPEFGHVDPCPVTVNPPPSTPARMGTAVPAAALEYSQFSDIYNPVPLPASA